MKKLIAFTILYSLFVILLCPSTKAQWEGAQIQQLTDDDLPNKITGLYIDDNDNLYLFYTEGVRDTVTGFVYDYRIFYITKEKGGDWSQPEEIETPEYIIGQNRKSVVGFDTKTGISHILYYGYALYDTLYYTNCDIPDWEFVRIDSLESGRKYIVPEMDFDSLGNVHIAWYESYWSGGSWVQYMYMNNSTGEWVKQAVSLPIWVGIGGSWPVALAVEKDGTAHITYGGAGVSECYYARNDSLNSQNWETDTIPKPSIPLCSHRYQELLADPSDRIHLFTRGYSCVGDTIFQFYYYNVGGDSIWAGPEVIQVHPPDSGLIRDYFIDQEDHVHLSLSAFGGFSVFYTNNKNGSWLEPELLLYEYDAPGAGESFRLVIDSQGRGHGVFTALDSSQGFWDDDSLEVYYLSSSNSAVDTEEDYKVFHFNLFQNYPNPFNSVTSIQYTVAGSQTKTADSRQPTADGSPIHTTHGKAVDGSQLIVHSPIHTTLKIYNILGKEVRELVNTSQSTGRYTITWDGKNNQGKEVASGIYFYQLKAGNFTETKKLVLIK